MKKAHAQQKRSATARGHLEKDPDDWVTGDEPMTAAQASYLKRLCEGSREAFSMGLTKAQASKRIDALRTNTNRLLERRAS